ncbi:Uncharacterized protein Rs2_39026 [Raphanus sativus]|nr:Uncharacterized protein Rs2_39026 [Raphanus sativus]
MWGKGRKGQEACKRKADQVRRNSRLNKSSRKKKKEHCYTRENSRSFFFSLSLAASTSLRICRVFIPIVFVEEVLEELESERIVVSFHHLKEKTSVDKDFNAIGIQANAFLRSDLQLFRHKRLAWSSFLSRLLEQKKVCFVSQVKVMVV